MIINPLFILSHGSIILVIIIIIITTIIFFSSSFSSSPPETSQESEQPRTLSLAFHLASSSSRHWRYDVFLSFCGEDVRRSFLSHVRREFDRMGIITFDDNGMERSESTSNVLIQAIQESRIAIVVLSKNYASSSWCLIELSEIMRCREAVGLKVIPLFYGVNPSDVRKQNRDFGRVFQRTCKGKSAEEKERWSKALNDVADLAGEHSQNWFVLFKHFCNVYICGE